MRVKWIFVGFFKAPLLCLFCLSEDTDLSGPEVVSAAPGGSATISFRYDEKFSGNQKYWCKGPVYEFCAVVVRTPKKQQNNRSLIVDDKRTGIITVTVHSLSKSDEDKYWCVISRHGRNVFTGVRLLVSESVPTYTTPSTLSMENDEISCWATLRWILFVLMLCCLVLTQITVWRIKTAKTTPKHQLLNKALNICK
ncbi:CMRF35-like molecule 3 [Betta splendens]|uniref:CMRF35-like molecule 3 n=1 Tax=Betta splendens TaxID=158456 RepID=A0A8M1HFT2_BETSP|nr:CMRF35-like molecule 3 [Betta splendens]